MKKKGERRKPTYGKKCKKIKPWENNCHVGNNWLIHRIQCTIRRKGQQTKNLPFCTLLVQFYALSTDSWKLLVGFSFFENIHKSTRPIICIFSLPRAILWMPRIPIPFMYMYMCMCMCICIKHGNRQ